VARFPLALLAVRIANAMRKRRISISCNLYPRFPKERGFPKALKTMEVKILTSICSHLRPEGWDFSQNFDKIKNNLNY